MMPGATTTLWFDREAIGSGQIVRLFTCHWTHHSISHLAWNLGVLLVAGGWLERAAPRVWWRCLGTSLALVGPGLWLLEPGLAIYAGGSGMATAVVTALALAQRRSGDSPRWPWSALLGLLAVKIAFEWAGAGSLFADLVPSDIRNVPMAHALGGLAGWLGAGRAFDCVEAMESPRPATRRPGLS
jgi:rhomboid family GlyGly-CTERM serine protease